jgi:hypothetical protein
MSLFIEFTVSAYNYILLGLTDCMGENSHREELVWALACLFMFVVTINIVVFARNLTIKTYEYLKRWIKSKRLKTVAIRK